MVPEYMQEGEYRHRVLWGELKRFVLLPNGLLDASHRTFVRRTEGPRDARRRVIQAVSSIIDGGVEDRVYRAVRFEAGLEKARILVTWYRLALWNLRDVRRGLVPLRRLSTTHVFVGLVVRVVRRALTTVD